MVMEIYFLKRIVQIVSKILACDEKQNCQRGLTLQLHNTGCIKLSNLNAIVAWVKNGTPQIKS